MKKLIEESTFQHFQQETTFTKFCLLTVKFTRYLNLTKKILSFSEFLKISLVSLIPRIPSFSLTLIYRTDALSINSNTRDIIKSIRISLKQKDRESTIWKFR